MAPRAQTLVFFCPKTGGRQCRMQSPPWARGGCYRPPAHPPSRPGVKACLARPYQALTAAVISDTAGSGPWKTVGAQNPQEHLETSVIYPGPWLQSSRHRREEGKAQQRRCLASQTSGELCHRLEALAGQGLQVVRPAAPTALGGGTHTWAAPLSLLLGPSPPPSLPIQGAGLQFCPVGPCR